MIDMRMHATIGNQPNEMHFFVICFGVFESVLNDRFLSKATVFYRHIQFYKVLINHSTSTQIHMSYFRVSHLSCW